MQELLGKQLGQYHIESKIGEGGMAVVFKAFQPSLERYVAIKVLPPTFAKDPDFVKRFQREAKSVASLNHPNILPVYDFGVDQGYSYIVMRYVEGGKTLRDVMRQPLSSEQAIGFIRQIAGALGYAHQQQIIHRDVKPGNVLLDGEWVLLSDFGLAKISRESAIKLTGTGIGIGTPAYISPEQGLGQKVDHRTDIYALGVILYEMLTGDIPHKADTPVGIVMKRSITPPPSPHTINPHISEGIAQVTVRSLAPAPAHRYDSATEFSTSLQRAMNDATYREPTLSQGTLPFPYPPLTEPTQASMDKTDGDADIGTTVLSGSKKDQLTTNEFWRNPILALIAGVTIISVIVWSVFNPGNLLSSSSSSTSQAGSLPDATSTATTTSLSSPTPTPSAVATSTPSPTSSPTATPPPTATPLLIVVTATATPTVTSSPTLDLPVVATPTLAPSPIPNLPESAFLLLKPIDLEQPSYGPTDFEWEWVGSLPPEFGFEVLVWQDTETPLGVHDAVLDNQNGQIEQIAPDRYRLRADISDAPGVNGRTGEYLWTVAIVRIRPEYAPLDQQAPPARLRFEAGGSGSNSGSDSSDGGGSSGPTIE